MRRHRDEITAFCLYLASLLDGESSPYQVLDGMGVRVRNAQRRGGGWLDGQANIGYSGRLRWYEGFYVLIASTPTGVVTGFGFAPGSTNDRWMAESFLAARADPQVRLPSVEKGSRCPYIMNKGYAGTKWQARWKEAYGADSLVPPEKNVKGPWPKTLRRWHASIRQIAETVHDKLLNVFRLDRERPHSLDGFQSRLAACIGLHNFCIYLNSLLGRNPLEFVDLVNY